MKETAFGVVPIRGKKILLVQHKALHWGLPKGHHLNSESSLETAERELFEETHLRVVRWLAIDPLEENYTFQRDGVTVEKKVVYFCADDHFKSIFGHN